MQDLIRRLEFRRFSYETDPEYLVDMHRSLEVLEGGWFDNEDTCRYHHKMVVRSNGSSWVGVISNAVIGYADLLQVVPGTGLVSRWRLHPDFHHPRVAKKMLDGLREEAKKHGFNLLVFFADSLEVLKDLESIGMTRDRFYKWVSLVDVDANAGVEVTEEEYRRHELLNERFIPFLGPPLPPGFLLFRAFMASDYGVFNFRSPKVYKIMVAGKPYFGCFDGREWFVFRREKHPEDAEAIRPVLSGLAGISEGKILLSGKAIEKCRVTPCSDEAFWDLFTEKI